MKTVAAFSNPNVADALIVRLEASGVRAFARDEDNEHVGADVTPASGSVKVVVAAEDYERALAVRDALPPETRACLAW